MRGGGGEREVGMWRGQGDGESEEAGGLVTAVRKGNISCQSQVWKITKIEDRREGKRKGKEEEEEQVR